jgi:hypothetical protein
VAVAVLFIQKLSGRMVKEEEGTQLGTVTLVVAVNPVLSVTVTK